MKNLLAITIFIFTIVCASISNAEWRKLTSNNSGVEFYIDEESIRTNKGYTFFWYLSNYNKRTSQGHLSSIIYVKLDCGTLGYKFLSDRYYTGTMGNGEKTGGSNRPDKDWQYYRPGSSGNKIFKYVCQKIK